MEKKAATTFCPSNKKQWRAWLKANHNKEQSVWLICYKQKSGMPTISWSDAVDEALCFGWIDGKAKPIDDDKFMRSFSRRKPRSMWSRINKEKVQKLIDDGSMTKAGLACVEIAKQNGSWEILDDIEDLIVPDDLEKALKTKRGSKAFFLSLSKSSKKIMLSWVTLAKRPETRQKRISEIVENAAQKLKPEQFR